MIVNADGRAIEWVAGTYLSQDKVAMQEIWDGVDQHTLNQEAFNLPSRLIAKTFVFRLIYGGTAYSYANDPDFTSVGYSEKKWQGVIDAFCMKYTGWDKWWTSLIQQATTTGKIINPATRRCYEYTKVRGEWPQTTIKNYIVQGLAADLMAIARVSFMKRFKNADINGFLVNTVHDSIVVDVHKDDIERTAQLFADVFSSIPDNFYKLFGVEFNLPVRCEVSVGKNMKELEEITIDI